ncbi:MULTISPECIES: ABC transporter permease [Maribacter]|uniref:ABC transporter permease n=1 Tax=Maribacter flavus TaxID=1658664 RepID=A0ABU7IFH4_9FLAO|nr:MULTISPECIES: ABC transporter permease [Maribacter]MDC6404566.1 ABC transporter permease [Maribacter sp. PR66]MEE1971709.1 ABC transporter permease [Maribacter flavus]
MFKNHIKIAWRSLKKQPFFTFLNTFGLAIGMAGALLISLYIYDELTYDTMFKDADRIYRINADIKFGGDARKYAVSPAPMADALQSDFSEIEVVTRFRTRGSALVRKADAEANVKEEQTTFVDATFFEMFGIELLAGDPTTALKNPNSIVMTRTAAEKHFGVTNAVGQDLILNNEEPFTVTGVIEDLPNNSFLRDYSLFEAMAGNEDAQTVNWGSNNYQTFFKLIPSADVESIKEPLQGFLGKYLIPWAQSFMPGITEEQFAAAGNYLIYSTIPLTDIHLSSNLVAEMSSNNDMQSIYILSFIAVFLVVLASVNFMNLSTAQSLKRAKEVGVRKTLGSNKRDLVRQFLVESGLISFISLLLALVLAVSALPFFNELADKDISLPFLSPFFWLILFGGVIVLGLFSGSYPAFFMSRFIPVNVLKGGGQSSVGGGKIRNSLVVFQFAISVFLIISTLVVYQQLKYIQSKDLGFSKDQVLVVNDVYTAGSKANSFKEQVKQLSFVKNATLSSFFPTPSSRSDSTFVPEEGLTDQENAVSMQTWGVDYDYVPTMGFEFVTGRNFDENFGNDSTAIIVNETAVKVMKLTPETALGERYSPDFNAENPEFFTIIGVVKDFHFESMKEEIDALSLRLANNAYAMAIKIEAGNFENAVSKIENVWNNIVPGEPFNYYFMDDSFNDSYQSERRLGNIFVIFTVLSIIIACLGLFGLAAFNAEKRVKEIGVRKVLGASVTQISVKLTMDFLKLVGVAILISLPLGWYAMDKWLEDFSYKIDIPWWVFALAALLAISVAVITVSYQSIKASIVNPVKSLRTE